MNIFFVNMGPYESQNFKKLFLPQITFASFQTFPEFSSQWSSQKCCSGFLKFSVYDFLILINIGPYGSENFKTILLLQFLSLSKQAFATDS